MMVPADTAMDIRALNGIMKLLAALLSYLNIITEYMRIGAIMIVYKHSRILQISSECPVVRGYRDIIQAEASGAVSRFRELQLMKTSARGGSTTGRGK